MNSLRKLTVCAGIITAILLLGNSALIAGAMPNNVLPNFGSLQHFGNNLKPVGLFGKVPQGSSILRNSEGIYSDLSSIFFRTKSSIYYIGDNVDDLGHIYELNKEENNWNRKDLTVETNGEPAGRGYNTITSITNSNGDPRIYYVGRDRNLYGLVWVGDKWDVKDISLASTELAEPVEEGSSITSTSVNGDPRIYYIGENDHIYEEALWVDSWQGSDNWHLYDLTTESNGGLAQTGSSITSITIDGDPRVYYIGKDFHIYEEAFVNDVTKFRDITTDTGGEPAVAGSSITSTTYDGDPRIYYIGDNNHVYEEAWWGGNWHPLDLTAITNGQPANGESAITSTIVDGNPYVYYIGENGHINEYVWSRSDWNWKFNDLPTKYTPDMVGWRQGSGLVSTTLDDYPYVYYIDQNGQIVELTSVGKGWESSELEPKN